ncbi:hypothetical protein ACLOJK_038604, partial [Asimina triloba]
MGLARRSWNLVIGLKRDERGVAIAIWIWVNADHHLCSPDLDLGVIVRWPKGQQSSGWISVLAIQIRDGPLLWLGSAGGRHGHEAPDLCLRRWTWAGCSDRTGDAGFEMKTLPPFVWMGPIGRSDPRRSGAGRQPVWGRWSTGTR